MLQNDAIPPHVGVKNRLNSRLPPLRTLNVRIPERLTEFKPRAKNSKRRIVVNNFDATGGNSSVLIEDPPARVIHGVDPRLVHIVAISAKTPFSFRANTENLLKYIQNSRELSIGDISYTTTARRMHYVVRASVAVSSVTELESSLQKLVTTATNTTRASSLNVAFVFTGQGSYYLKMGNELFNHCLTFRRNILEYDRICQRHDLPSFKALIDGSEVSLEAVSQIQVELALIALELALANLCLSLDIRPSVVVGHSLGEYAALCVAGVLSVNDTFFLVGKRASLMTAKCSPNTHSMLAVMREAASVKKDLIDTASSCEIACLNGPQSTVISGRMADIAFLKTFYKSKDVKTTQLEMPFAFHSSQLDPILEDFRLVAESVPFHEPVIPIASTLLGSIAKQKGIFTAEYLCRHAREPVQFLDALEECKATGIIDARTLWLEIGPSSLCLSMVKAILKVPEHSTTPTLKQGESSLSTIATCVSKVYTAGIDINWMAYQREYESAHRLLPLPNYAFDVKNYWIQYEGDWSLRKNVASAPQLIQPLAPTFSGTTSLQRVENEKFGWSGASVVFSSDLCEPKLREAVRGHAISGIALCSISIFEDMAFTAAKYIHHRCDPFAAIPSIDVTCMEALHPLILTDGMEKQLVYISATRKAGSDIVALVFSSGKGSADKAYATCNAQYGSSAEWMTEWKRHAYLIQSRMDHLVKAVESGKSCKLSKSMAYKLFSVLIQYSDKYRAMEEVWMDSTMLEAVANIKFQSTIEDGSFEHSPYSIDGVIHLGGLVLNGADTRPENIVYAANGWKSLRILGHLSADKLYKSYVRMQPINDKNLMSGDVYVFDNDEIIAVCDGFKFQQVPRSVLEYLLLPSVNTVIARTSQIVLDDEIWPEATVGIIPGGAFKSSAFDDILEIIALETGVEKTEFHDEMSLIELGVDSLLTISILARLHRLTNINLPTSLFQVHPTVEDLRKFFECNPTVEIKAASVPIQSFSAEYPATAVASKRSSNTTDSHADIDISDRVRSTIAAEVGCEETEILPSTILSDLGVDSPMSLAIVEKIRSKTGVQMPATFFPSQLTLSDFVRQFKIASATTTAYSLSPETTVKAVGALKQSTSILLQGTSFSLPPLFLLPDGSGSASSYVPLPVFNNRMVVYGLNSPFLDSPSEFTCTVEEAARLYLTEIRTRQSSGPYILGGWSAGGILAYETATQLVASGEKVLGVILIDSPCPISLPPLSLEYFDFFDSIGILDNIHKSSNRGAAVIKEHFVAWINAVRYYQPTPIDPSKAPTAVVLWAKEGILESISDKKIATPGDKSSDELKNWLLYPKEQFGSGGWEKLLPNIQCAIVPGNHFTIMRQPQITTLGKEIEKAVLKITKIS